MLGLQRCFHALRVACRRGQKYPPAGVLGLDPMGGATCGGMWGAGGHYWAIAASSPPLGGTSLGKKPSSGDVVGCPLLFPPSHFLRKWGEPLRGFSA